MFDSHLLDAEILQHVFDGDRPFGDLRVHTEVHVVTTPEQNRRHDARLCRRRLTISAKVRTITVLLSILLVFKILILLIGRELAK